MAVSKKAVQPTMADLFEQAREELEGSINRSNILNYVPYPEQLRFHQSQAIIRFISGGNRGGKTDSAVVDAIYTATDTHPYRSRPAEWGTGPIQLRFIVVDIDQGVNEFIIPKLRRWCAKSMLIDGQFEKSWNPGSLTFTFANGSSIDFLTHGMALNKHGGVPRHGVYFDEIPPQAVYNENAMRMIDYHGFIVIAATSVDGLGWTYDAIWEPVEEGKVSKELIDVFTMSQEQNPYLAGNTESRDIYYLAMDASEESIRRHGAMTARSGLIFPNFSSKTHVIPEFVPPKNWEWFSSVDFGFNAPTAWLWHGVSPGGDIVTFAEHYMREMTVPGHSRIVHEMEDEWKREPDIRVGDPAGRQRQLNSGTSAIQEYAVNGIYISTEMIPRDVEIGIEKMHQYFEVRPKTGWGENRPKWVITENCVNFIKELRKLRWETYESSNRAYELNKKETVHKKDDHAFDSARYFATMQPDVTPIERPEPEKVKTVSYIEMMTRLRGDDSVTFAEDQQESVTVWSVSNGWDD